MKRELCVLFVVLFVLCAVVFFKGDMATILSLLGGLGFVSAFIHYARSS
jgi:hypothetical protein